MLSRVARQKNAIPHLRRLNSCRALPSTATLRCHSHSSRPNPLTNAPITISQERSRLQSLQSNRNLATAADQSVLEQGPYSESQYDGMASLFPSFQRDFDPSSLIIVDEALQTQPRTTKFHRGIGGDMDEMKININLSLQCHQFDRAATLINRLVEYYNVGSSEFRDIHNRFLHAMVSHMIITRRQNMILPWQRWFEVEMPGAKVHANASTYAVMLRMALPDIVIRLISIFSRQRH